MITKPILSRQLFDISVYQRTSDGYFNATSFAKEASEAGRVIRLDQFLSTDKTIEFIKELEISLNENTQEIGYSKMAVKSTRGKKGGSHYHPILFWKLAAWVSPKWEVKVYTWVNDDLVNLRLIAGDLYKEMCNELNRWYKAFHKKDTPPEVFTEQAMFLNELVFGNPAGNQRNIATPQQMDMLCKLTKANIKLIRERVTFSKRVPILKEFKRLSE
jgi:hypothetical protein